MDELEANYETLIRKLPPLIGLGLAAAVYTQTTDVEGEVNGLMTYDRAVVKRDVSRVAALHHKLYLPPPVLVRTTILPTSEQTAQTWHYTTQEPPDGWERPGFEDSGWKVGAGGFGRKDTPGSIVRTPWHTENVWLRRTFQWHGDIQHALRLRMHHDEDTEIYLNGHNIATAAGYTTGYEEIECAEAAREALKRGVNVIAVHCRQTRGGQYIDVGLIDVEEKEVRKAGKSLE